MRYKYTNRLRILLKRMEKCDQNWRFVDNANESGYYRNGVNGFGITRTNKELAKRYKMLLQDVLDNPSYFKNFPRFETLEELEMKLDIMGY